MPKESFVNVENIYWCNDNKTTITERSTVITEIKGLHDVETNRNHDHVEGFVLVNTTINYFPRNIENIFKNLLVIVVRNASLLEIHREDLAGFPELLHLNLVFNKLQVLEKDLFMYNGKLEYLSLYKNNLKYVDAKVFANLANLVTLNFAMNPCSRTFTSRVENNRQEVVKLTKKVVEKCFAMSDVFEGDYRVNKTFNKLKEEIFNLTIETKKINDAISKLKSEVGNVSSKNSELEVEKDKIMQEKSQIEAENSKLTQNLTNFIQNYKNVEEERKALEATKLNLENDLKTLKATFEELKTQKAETDAEFTDLKQNFTTLDVKITEIEAKAIETTQENLKTINDKEIRIKDLEVETHNQSEAIDELKTNFTNLQLANLDYQKQKVSNEAVISRLQYNMSKLEDEKSQLEEKIVNHKENASNILVELNKCKENGENLSENLQNCIKTADECSVTHRKCHTDLENQNTITVNLNDEIAKLTTSKNTVTDENKQLLDQINLLEVKKALLEGDIEVLNQNQTQLLENHAKLTLKHENLQNILELTNQSLATCDENHKKSTQNYSAVVDELNRKLSQLTLDISDLNTTKANNTETIVSLMSVMDEQSTEVEMSNVKIYIAIGIIGLLTILNVITLVKTYGKKRDYFVSKMELVTDSKYRTMSVDDLNDAGMTTTDGGFCNPVFDDGEMGGIVEVETSMAGLHGIQDEGGFN